MERAACAPSAKTAAQPASTTRSVSTATRRRAARLAALTRTCPARREPSLLGMARSVDLDPRVSSARPLLHERSGHGRSPRRGRGLRAQAHSPPGASP